MGSKQQRRADKKRQNSIRLREIIRTMEGTFPANPDGTIGRSRRHTFHSLGRLTVGELIDQGLNPTSMPAAAFATQLEEIVDLLVDADGQLAHRGAGFGERPEHILSSHLVNHLGELWERGWQPADIVHVVRNGGSQRIARLASQAIVSDEHNRDRWREVMPDWWAAQVAALDAVSAPNEIFATWRAERAISLNDALLDGLRLLAMLRRLPTIATIGDPPSRWAAAAQARRQRVGADTARDSAARRAEASEKVLATIRALLAKAESTTFPAEAEAFATKAQALMSRHSIDAAMLDPRHGDELIAGVEVRRLHLDNPYAKEKVSLLAVVARINQARVVYDEVHAMATIFGFPADLDATDLLFTSLLVQASRSLSEASAAIGRATSPAFRRAFWIAYAARIGERLDEAREEATAEAQVEHGVALVPILQERADAVDTVLQRVFTRTTPMKSRQVDSQGWYAGRTAADLADLGNQRSPLTR